jgi:NOL1/NOP2/fmu family ribosome biogenesis protein
MMRTVTLVHSIALANQSLAAGVSVEVDEATAKEWEAAGYIVAAAKPAKSAKPVKASEDSPQGSNA